MPCSRLLTLAHGLLTVLLPPKLERAPDTFFTLCRYRYEQCACKVVLQQQLPIKNYCHMYMYIIRFSMWQNSFHESWRENWFPSPCQSFISKVDPQLLKIRMAPIQWQWRCLAKPGVANDAGEFQFSGRITTWNLQQVPRVQHHAVLGSVRGTVKGAGTWTTIYCFGPKFGYILEIEESWIKLVIPMRFQEIFWGRCQLLVLGPQGTLYAHHPDPTLSMTQPWRILVALQLSLGSPSGNHVSCPVCRMVEKNT